MTDTHPTPEPAEISPFFLHVDSHTLLRLGGELDIAIAPALRERLLTLLTLRGCR